MTSSQFGWGNVPPESNTTAALVAELTSQVATVTAANSSAQQAATNAAASASNAALSEANVADLAQQATSTLNAANTAVTNAQTAVTTATAAVTSATASANTAASQAGTATTQAFAAAASATASSNSAAAASASQTAAASSASTASTQAANAAASATTASTAQSAASTSATAAASSASSASSAQSAAASSASAASTSAGNAAASATAAGNSAGNAATSATNASNSASSAASSASAAAASAASIALPIPISSGGTGKTTIAGAVQALGLSTLAGRNRIINGDCRVQQYAANLVATSSTTFGYGGVDRYQGYNGASGQFTQAPGSITFNGVVKPAVVQTVNTAQASFGSGQWWGGIIQKIEGYNCYDLLGQPVAVSFIFQTNVTGTYSAALTDATPGYSCVTTFSATAGVPVEVTLSFPAVPTAASIPRSNLTGMRLLIGALGYSGGGNTGATATLNAWQSGTYYYSSTTSTNWAAASGNYISLTELQVEVGTVSTPFEREPYSTTLQKCMRYYWNTYEPGVAPGTASTDPSALWAWTGPTADNSSYLAITVNHPVPMRASPSVALYSPHTGALNKAWSQNAGADLGAGTAMTSSRNYSLSLANQAIVVHDYIKWHATFSAEL